MTDSRPRPRNSVQDLDLRDIYAAQNLLEAWQGIARVSLRQLKGSAAYVCAQLEKGNALEIVAIEGDRSQVQPIGTRLESGLEFRAIAQNSAIRVSNVRSLTGKRITEQKCDAMVIPLANEGVAVVIGKWSSPDILETALLLAVTARATLHQIQATQESQTIIRRLRAQVAISHILVSGSLDDTFSHLLARLGEEIPFECSAISTLLRGSPNLLVFGSARASSVPIGSINLAMLAKHMQQPNVRKLGPVFLSSAESTGLLDGCRSSILVPLVVQDALIGIWALTSSEDNLTRASLPLDAAWLLEGMGEGLALAVQTSLLVRNLRDEKRNWQSIVDAMSSSVLLLDEHSIVRWCNHAFAVKASALGIDLVGKSAKDLFPDSPLPPPSTRGELSLAGKETFNAHLLRLNASEFALILSEPRAASFRPASSQHPMDQGGRILVVDDEPGILRAFTRALSRQHEVVTASDGIEARDILLNERFSFDVIITDVSMIRMGGVELYRWIERENPTVTSRVFFMTGGVFDYEVESFLQSGPIRHRVLRKPFDPEVLQRMINERLRR